MPTELQRKAQELQVAIFANEYYVPLYLKALDKYGLNRKAIDEADCTDSQIISVANKMWMDLPDSGRIRRPPFGQLCEIAEYIFDGHYEED